MFAVLEETGEVASSLSLDVNSCMNKSDSHYPILFFRDVGNFQLSFPSDRYKSVFHFYHQVRVKKNTIFRNAYPIVSTALVFRCMHDNPGAFFMGTLTAPYEMEYMISGGDYFVALFWPGISHSFCPFPSEELKNRYIPLNQILPGESEKITERMVFAKTYQERVHVFEQFLDMQMPMLRKVQNPFHSIYRALCCDQSMFTVEKLAKEACYTDRHIRRLFLKYVGVPPKLFISIVRCQKILRALNAEPHQGLAELAFEYGYYDQSHFIKEFKRFQGITPAQFISDFPLKDTYKYPSNRFLKKINQ